MSTPLATYHLWMLALTLIAIPVAFGLELLCERLRHPTTARRRSASLDAHSTQPTWAAHPSSRRFPLGK